MIDADGHKDTHGAPKGGWPKFDKDGKLVKEVQDEVVRSGKDARS